MESWRVAAITASAVLLAQIIAIAGQRAVSRFQVRLTRHDRSVEERGDVYASYVLFWRRVPERMAASLRAKRMIDEVIDRASDELARARLGIYLFGSDAVRSHVQERVDPATDEFFARFQQLVPSDARRHDAPEITLEVARTAMNDCLRDPLNSLVEVMREEFDMHRRTRRRSL